MRCWAAKHFDADTNFCLGWFEEMGWSAGAFGNADVLARAKGTSVDGGEAAGVVASDGGKVRLFKPDEYPADWDPREDNRTPVWEALHQLIRALTRAASPQPAHCWRACPNAAPTSAACLLALHPVRAQEAGRRRPQLQRAGYRLARHRSRVARLGRTGRAGRIGRLTESTMAARKKTTRRKHEVFAELTNVELVRPSPPCGWKSSPTRKSWASWKSGVARSTGAAQTDNPASASTGPASPK